MSHAAHSTRRRCMNSGRLRDENAKVSNWLGSKLAGATSRASALPHSGQTRGISSEASGLDQEPLLVAGVPALLFVGAVTQLCSRSSPGHYHVKSSARSVRAFV